MGKMYLTENHVGSLPLEQYTTVQNYFQTQTHGKGLFGSFTFFPVTLQLGKGSEPNRSRPHSQNSFFALYLILGIANTPGALATGNRKEDTWATRHDRSRNGVS